MSLKFLVQEKHHRVDEEQNQSVRELVTGLVLRERQRGNRERIRCFVVLLRDERHKSGHERQSARVVGYLVVQKETSRNQNQPQRHDRVALVLDMQQADNRKSDMHQLVNRALLDWLVPGCQIGKRHQDCENAKSNKRKALHLAASCQHNEQAEDEQRQRRKHDFEKVHWIVFCTKIF